MAKMILAYNFTPERLLQLRHLAMLIKANCREVKEGETDLAIGYLAGLKDVDMKAQDPEDAAQQEEKLIQAAAAAGENEDDVKEAAARIKEDAAKKEMVLLAGLGRNELDRFLAQVKKSPLRQIELKAILTPHNLRWSGRHLLTELYAEHIYMHSKKKSLHSKN